MSTLLPLLLAIAALLLLWQLVTSLFQTALPGEPAGSVEDPLEPVPAPRRRGPPGKAGAVALEEPDDDEPPDYFPPRKL